MVKIAPRQADAFAEAPDPAIRAVLVHGADQGLVCERADKLCRSVVEDIADPFRVAELDGAAVLKDPGLLYDEAASLALTGGRRVVRVRHAPERLAESFAEFLKTAAGEALIVAEAGELAASSKLRKVFEASKAAAAMACYRDEGRDLVRLVEDELRSHGLTADRDALGLMVSYLGGDRLLTRAEIAKLAVYMGDGRAVALLDVEAVMADGSFLSHERIVAAVLAGRPVELGTALDRAFAERENPVAIVNAVRRELQRLDLYLGLVGSGRSPDAALKAMRLDPRRQFRIVEPLKAAAGLWSPIACSAALDILLDADLLLKSTGYPDETLCRHALQRIVAGIGRKRRVA